MTDQSEALKIKTPRQCGEIGDVTIQTMCLLASGLFGEPESNHVWDDHAVASVHQRLDKRAI